MGIVAGTRETGACIARRLGLNGKSEKRPFALRGICTLHTGAIVPFIDCACPVPYSSFQAGRVYCARSDRQRFAIFVGHTASQKRKRLRLVHTRLLRLLLAIDSSRPRSRIVVHGYVPRRLINARHCPP